MNTSILKYINEFFKAFEKDHTFYIDGERIKFCKATGLYVIWDIGHDWCCLGKEEINAVTIEGMSLKITVMGGKEYTFIAKAKSEEEIISLLKSKLIPLSRKEEIKEVIYLLDELERINKERKYLGNITE